MEIKITVMAVEKLVVEKIEVTEFILNKEEALALTRLFGASNTPKRIALSKSYSTEDDKILYGAWSDMDNHFMETMGCEEVYPNNE